MREGRESGIFRSKGEPLCVVSPWSLNLVIAVIPKEDREVQQRKAKLNAPQMDGGMGGRNKNIFKNNKQKALIGL